MAGLKREIHHFRVMADKWARMRDEADFERERGRRWELRDFRRWWRRKMGGC